MTRGGLTAKSLVNLNPYLLQCLFSHGNYLQVTFKWMNQQLTTFHFFPSSSNTGGSVRVGVAAAAGRAAEEAKGFGPARTAGLWLLRVGFLWVFSLSLTCFRPGEGKEARKRDNGIIFLHRVLLILALNFVTNAFKTEFIQTTHPWWCWTPGW